MSRSETNTDKDKTDLSATGIIKLIEEAQVRLFHSPLKEHYATLWTKEHWETWRIKSSTFEEWMASMCYHQHGAVPSKQAIAEAKSVLAGRALFGSPEGQVYVRVAGHKGAIYVDLANESWEAVRITGEGWDVVSGIPIKFIRAPGMKPLPLPVDCGSIDDLRSVLNFEDDDQWKLTESWLIGALRPVGPFPLLVVEGIHGSAKSTAARLLRALVDPNAAPLRAAPLSPRDLAISAENSWCLGFDNLSSVKPWLSDALCRLSTGGGFSTRALYRNADEWIFDGMRPVLLNGINIGIDRSDLLDRTIMLSLPVISDDSRQTEAEVWERFETLRPSILGGLFDAVAAALRRFPEIKLPRLPRMADFATWVCAAEPALGWPEGSFLDVYRRNRSEADALALEASPLVEPITRIAEREAWEGTATELHGVLTNELLNCQVVVQGSFPKTPKELSQAIRRLAPNLLRIGIAIQFSKTPGDKSKRIVSIRKVGVGVIQAAP